MRKVNFFNYLLVFMLIATIIFFAKVVPNVSAQPRGGSIRIGLMGDTNPLKPNDVIDKNTLVVVPQIFETLITADESMNFKPNLATSWQTTSEGTAIIFSLRKGVRFHDGTPFNAIAVKMTFDRMMNEKLKRWTIFANFLKSVEIIDENTVKFNLKGSPGAFLTMLPIAGYIESPAAVEKHGKDIGLHPSGTGPFKFVEWLPDQRIALEANKGYWGGEPKLAQVVFKPVPDRNTRAAMLEAGDLDVVLGIPYMEIDRLKSLPGIRIAERLSSEQIFITFNTLKKPFGDKRIRQAISYSIDRKGIVNALLLGKARLAETYALADVKHVFKYDIYPYNPEKAKSILAGLGWKLGKSGYLEKDGEIFKVSIVTPSGRYPLDREIAEAIQAQLKKVGIDLKVMILESGAYVKAIFLDRQARQGAEFGMLLIGRPMGPDPDTAFTQHFHSNYFPPNGINISAFVNVALDRALEEGARTIDETKRGAIYKKAQDILNEEIPWLPIYASMDFVGFRKGVKGIGYPSPFSNFCVGRDAQLER